MASVISGGEGLSLSNTLCVKLFGFVRLLFAAKVAAMAAGLIGVAPGGGGGRGRLVPPPLEVAPADVEVSDAAGVIPAKAVLLDVPSGVSKLVGALRVANKEGGSSTMLEAVSVDLVGLSPGAVAIGSAPYHRLFT